MKLDERDLLAIKRAVAALEEPHGAAPAEVLAPLIDLARPGTKLRLDVAASDVVGAPVVSFERSHHEALLAPLTARQKEVARLMIDGLSNRQIAADLGISVATVKDHVHAILDRLGLTSRIALISRAGSQC